MGWYTDRILPRILHKACGAGYLNPLRERVCAGLTGEVVEIGFGSGPNVAFYPQTVTDVRAVEPADLAWQLAADRISASAVPIERCGLNGASLPFPDATFDSALSTWTMCTIPDLGVALGELRRVLKPGGRLCFLEHGLAPDVNVQRWQRRFEPVQKRIAGGCHITRPIVSLIGAAGFAVTEVDTFYEKQGPKMLGALALGTAVSA